MSHDPLSGISMPSVDEKSARAYTVLLVEDEPLIALTLVDILEELGHSTIEAMTGAEAIRAFEERDDIDLLVTDIGLPDISGDALAEKLRSIRPDLPVVFATGRRPNGQGPDPLGNPPTAWLGKPFQMTDLQSVIDSLMAGRETR